LHCELLVQVTSNLRTRSERFPLLILLNLVLYVLVLVRGACSGAHMRTTRGDLQ